MLLEKNKDKFIKRAKKAHGNKYSYAEVIYKNAKTRVKILCDTHGYFEQTPDNHVRNHGCPKCNGGVNSNTREFIYKSKEAHSDKYDYSLVVYTNNTTKVSIKCPEHGIFKQLPSEHIYGSGCRECSYKVRANKKRSNVDSFIEKAKLKHGDVYDYSKVKYVDSKTKVKIICITHGEFSQTPNSHLMKQGCPACKKSKGEMAIRLYLKGRKIQFDTEKRFKDCRKMRPLPFDFYLPGYNLCIEFDGKQHFLPGFFGGKRQSISICQINDSIKNDYCTGVNGRPSLIRIKYLDIDKIAEILDGFL